MITDPSLEVVRNGQIEFVPENWTKTYYQWLENIEDWCISRQIWWGHRIPAWYDDQGTVYVAKDEATVRSKYQLDDALQLNQDPDVLDTWFSSALWPFSTLGWPQKTPRLETFYPTSVLVTGFDIIFFWVARMIMMGTRFMGEVPFRQVYIHGLIRDAHGQKMSKSKGNVLDPIDLIDGIELEQLVAKRTKGMMQPHLEEKIAKQTRNDYPEGIPGFGTDALRFTFAALASNGRDINFDLGRIEGYRNFCNKIWNAARYVLMNVEGHDTGLENDQVSLSVADRWMVSQLQRSEQRVADAVTKYRFDMAANEIYDLVWNRYCDWYLELCKAVLNDENASAEQHRGTRRTMVQVLETMLRLAHPIMPFITEEIWQRVAEPSGKQGETIMTQPYPVAESHKLDPEAESEVQWLMDMILAVRKIRGEMDISAGKRVPVLIADSDDADRERLSAYGNILDNVGRIESVEVLASAESAPESAIAMVGNLKLLIPLEGLIDKDAELQRLNRQLEQRTQERQRIDKKLSNEGFVSKAPAEVVAKERTKLQDLDVQISGLNEQIRRISRI